MKYVIGLGNPGEKYKTTRHNIAWLIFDALGLSDWVYDKYMNAEFVGEDFNDEIILYVKPQTFMNRSGEVLAILKKQKDFLIEDIILVYDDVDLEFGDIRISYNRGDGGHNGVRSIVNHLGTKKITRIRVGISKRIEDGRLIKPNVLSCLMQSELDVIEKEIVIKIKEILESLIADGVEKTMNIYNGR